jgi:hypothetical protein
MTANARAPTAAKPLSATAAQAMAKQQADNKATWQSVILRHYNSPKLISSVKNKWLKTA